MNAEPGTTTFTYTTQIDGKDAIVFRGCEHVWGRWSKPTEHTFTAWSLFRPSRVVQVITRYRFCRECDSMDKQTWKGSIPV